MNSPFRIQLENAKQVHGWITRRGGLTLWPNVNTEGIVEKYTTSPALSLSGQSMTRPSSRCSSSPERVITSAAQVTVVTPVEVTRLKVETATPGDMSLSELAPVSVKRLSQALLKAGADSWHEFDYSTREAIVYRIGAEVTLEEWALVNAPSGQYAVAAV